VPGMRDENEPLFKIREVKEREYTSRVFVA
jgi:hypothetical protein